MGSGSVSFPNSSGGFYFFITRWKDSMPEVLLMKRLSKNNIFT